MARAGGRLSARPLLCCQLLLLLVSASSFAPSDCRLRSIAAHRHRHHRHPQKKPSSSSPPALLLLLGAVVAKSSSAAAAARIPPSPADRDASAISSVRNALSKPRSATFPLIECEFPSLPSLNKLGDGSLRSSMEAEDSNVSFVARLVGGLSSPMPVLFGPKVSVVTSTSAPASLVEKVRKSVSSGKGGGGGGVVVYSLKGGGSSIIPERAGGGGKKEVFVFLTPSSMGDYRAARELAESGRAVVIVNGSFKVRVVCPPPRAVCRRRVVVPIIRPLPACCSRKKKQKTYMISANFPQPLSSLLMPPILVRVHSKTRPGYNIILYNN